jgi:hypothetical protein
MGDSPEAHDPTVRLDMVHRKVSSDVATAPGRRPTRLIGEEDVMPESAGQPAVSRQTAVPLQVRIVRAEITRANRCRILGRHRDAEVLLRAALQRAEAALGPETAEVAELCAALGCVCKETGRFSDAEALYRRALAIAQRIIGRRAAQP